MRMMNFIGVDKHTTTAHFHIIPEALKILRGRGHKGEIVTVCQHRNTQTIGCEQPYVGAIVLDNLESACKQSRYRWTER